MIGLCKSKNNKIIDYKMKLVNLIINPYLKFVIEENFANQVIAFNNLSSLLKEFSSMDIKIHIEDLFQNLKINLKTQTMIDIKTANNLMNGMINYQGIIDNLFLQNIYDKLTFNYDENSKINLPLVSILMKNISHFPDYMMPDEKFIKSLFNFLKKEIPFYIKKNLIVRETLFAFKLMNKSKIIDTSLIELLYQYNCKEIHLINFTNYCFEEFKIILKQVYTTEEYLEKMNSICLNIEETITESDFNGILLTFDLFLKSCFFAERENELTNLTFNCLINKINNSYNDRPKIIMNLINNVIVNQGIIFEKFKTILIEKMLDGILDNFEEISIFDYSLCKLFIFISESKNKVNDLKIIEKKEEILKLINIKFLNNCSFNFFKGLKMICENTEVKITNRTLINLLKIEFSNKHINQFEHIILFVYFSLVKDKENIIDVQLYNQLLNKNSTNNQIRVSISFKETVGILQLFNQKKIECHKLIKIFEDQLIKKLITKAEEVRNNEVSELIKSLMNQNLLDINSEMIIRKYKNRII